MKIDVSDLIGVPFVEFGRDKRTGLDCYGLVIEVAKRYGKNLKDIALEKFDYDKVRKVEPELNVKRTKNYMQECIGLEFYGVFDKRLHIGITIDDKGTFLHATENQGVRVSTIESCKGYLKLKNAFEII